jgi:hypothetical protein
MLSREANARDFLEKGCATAECLADTIAFSANARGRAGRFEENIRNDFLNCAVLGSKHEE